MVSETAFMKAWTVLTLIWKNSWYLVEVPSPLRRSTTVDNSASHHQTPGHPEQRYGRLDSINNDKSASVYKSSPLGRITRYEKSSCQTTGRAGQLQAS